MTLEYVLKQHGLTPGVDVEVINNVQFNLMGGAFESGTGDFVTLFEPTASEFEAAGKGYIVANVGLESGEVPYTAFMVAPETIENDPEFVEAFVRAACVFHGIALLLFVFFPYLCLYQDAFSHIELITENGL